MKAEIISVGSELTSGQNLDTNAQWLSRRLAEIGIPVGFHTTVADDLDDNVAVFRTATERADLVLSTGGLGPTQDDLTREALAAVAGVELVEDTASLEHIREMFARRGRAMPERNRVQAQFPRGAEPILNDARHRPRRLDADRPGRRRRRCRACRPRCTRCSRSRCSRGSLTLGLRRRRVRPAEDQHASAGASRPSRRSCST